jgi:hypothetical protein
MRIKKFAIVILRSCFGAIAWGEITGGVSIDSVQKIYLPGSIGTCYHKSEQDAPRTFIC